MTIMAAVLKKKYFALLLPSERQIDGKLGSINIFYCIITSGNEVGSQFLPTIITALPPTEFYCNNIQIHDNGES